MTRSRNDHRGHEPADPSRILASIGLVPYDWRVDTDTIVWGANAAEVLQVRDIAALGSRAAAMRASSIRPIRRRAMTP